MILVIVFLLLVFLGHPGQGVSQFIHPIFINHGFKTSLHFFRLDAFFNFFFPFFMASISGRQIPLQALMTTVPDPARRGAFLSVNSAMQYLGTGMGAWVGGLLLSTGPGGRIDGYEINGWLAAGLTLFNLLWIATVKSRPAPVASRSG